MISSELILTYNLFEIIFIYSY